MGVTKTEAKEWLKSIKEKYIHGGDDFYDYQRRTAIDYAIENIVEVVRCRDCKHWDEIEDTCGGGYCNHRCWFVLDAEPPIVNHSDFCSYGERRKDV